MSLVPTLAVGKTDNHWVNVLAAYVEWFWKSNQIDENVYRSVIGKLNDFATGARYPSYKDFAVSFKEFLASPDESKILDAVPETTVSNVANKLLIKQTNEYLTKKLYRHRNTFRDLALANKYLFQLKAPEEVTTLGYRFASYYTTLSTLLEKVIFDRRYVETVNSLGSLESFIDSHTVLLYDANSPTAQDFVAKKLELFNVAFFHESKTNWFVEALKNLAEFGSLVVKDLKDMNNFGEVSLNNDLLNSAQDSAWQVLTYKSEGFWLNFGDYEKLVSLLYDLFSKLDDLLKHITVHKSVIEGRLGFSFDKDKCLTQLESLFERIFDGERKRQVFDEIFCEAPEVDNMIYRVAQQLNNEYRHETGPVCCVGFTEGVVLFLGKIIPLLNFSLYMITVKVSFYGSDTMADKNKEVNLEFDESKYNGKRVLIFDDLLEQGVTTVKFIEQARARVKAKDYKVCVLFTKNLPGNVYGDPDFVGGVLPNVWVVGYGFDTLFKHRNADAVGSIKEEFKTE